MTHTNIFDRVALIDKVIINHPALAKAITGIYGCVERTQFFREPVGSLLLAEGGMGKTTVCKTLLSRMPESLAEDVRSSRTLVPAFYAEIPSPATVKTVAAVLLGKLNDPSPLVGNVAQLTQRVCVLLKECETKLILLDEFHHLFNFEKRSNRINVNVCNWIKSIVNATSVSICLVGSPAFAPLLTTDTQLARRFSYQFKLNSLIPGSSGQSGDLVGFLAELGQQAMQRLDVKTMPRFEDPVVAHQMFAATSGIPSFVMALIKEGLIHAFHSGSNSLSIEDLRSAWDTGITAHACLTKSNPFMMSQGVLAANLRGRI